MDTKLLEKQFARMGARLKVRVGLPTRRVPLNGFGVNIGTDHRGPFFDVSLGPDRQREVEVLDVQANDRHLLLMVREHGARQDEKHKYLCGHDERDWFAAAVPEERGVSTVRTAMEALKPREVMAAQVRKGLKARHRNRRHNKAFIRQGEWFFVLEPDMVVDAKLVLRNEPLSRGRGKPHWAEEAFRTGGETVYVCVQFPQGVNEERYRQLLARSSGKRFSWRTMRRDAGVFVRGRVRHPDHKTIRLNGWHRVMPNTESQAASMQHLTFLD